MVLRRTCGCHDDGYEVKRDLLRRLKTEKVADDGQTIYVGIVFHIMFSGYDEGEIAKDVDYTIKMLNNDYNRRNSNFNQGASVYKNTDLRLTYNNYVDLAASCNLTFYPVKTLFAPIGTQWTNNTSILDQNIKGKSPALESQRYLNLWIVDLSSGLLGYSQFPWELGYASQTDGVVIARGTFGRSPSYQHFNLNKTLTHESGHWFGLYHTFQETFNYQGGNIDYTDVKSVEEYKGDCVIDTPPQSIPTYGNPFMQPETWPTSQPYDENKPYRALFMDFMDYSDDIAMFMFTKDQASKIRQMIRIYRPQILNNHPALTGELQPIPETRLIPESEKKVENPVFTLSHSFEYGDDQEWATSWELIDQKHSSDAEISKNRAHSGNTALRTRYSAKGKISADLSGLTTCNLSFYARAKNPYTYVWLKPPGNENWYTLHLKSNKYQNYLFALPGPFNSVKGENYQLLFGTGGTSSVYSYFDDIVLNSGSSLQLQVVESKKLNESLKKKRRSKKEKGKKKEKKEEVKEEETQQEVKEEEKKDEVKEEKKDE